jgi:CP family cyanate transporter-like MFS transporter
MQRSQVIRAVALLWLAGNALRLSLLAVPPVLATLQADLAMSGTQVGILNGLPVALFAIAALPGSLLIARLGAVPALVAGLLLAAVGSGLREFVSGVGTLFAATIAMGVGIAVMQPAMPAVVRQWLPDRIGFATAVFTNGLIMGEIIPVAAMTPLVLPLVGGGWREGLAFWALPLAAIAALLVWLAPRSARPLAGAAIVRLRWWPDWNDGLVWRLGLILGAANSGYFGSNAFLPGHLVSAGRPDLIAPALTALNLGQLPASFLLLAFASRLERQAWPVVTLCLACMAGIAGMALTASGWTVAFATMVGFSAGGTLVLSLALPPLLKAPAEIAPTSAAMFVMGYSEALIMSVIGGALWDATGSAAFAFLPPALALLPAVLLPRTLRFPDRAADVPSRATA